MLESDVQGLLSGSSSLLTITLYSLSSDSFNVILNVFLVFFYFPVGEFYRSVFPNIISPEYGRKALTWSTIIWGVKG